MLKQNPVQCRANTPGTAILYKQIDYRGNKKSEKLLKNRKPNGYALGCICRETRCISSNSRSEAQSNTEFACASCIDHQWNRRAFQGEPSGSFEACEDTLGVRAGGYQAAGERAVLRSKTGQAWRGGRLDRAVPQILGREA